ncbi:MAG: hypothetical protein CVU77_08080 [Elusimicrobia bacterium HGW-Elusimicrobia-1]|nr:MAG: hypothetical protein CVU77_08080 [Elusimicrobia bacterium HGW-Elusimicrobia-1]
MSIITSINTYFLRTRARNARTRAKGKNRMNKKKKKKYVKPRIKSEKIFETAALACGKCIAGNPITGGACFAVTRLS